MTIPPARRIVLCGAGFLGSNIARAIGKNASKSRTPITIQISSRKPARIHGVLSREIPCRILAPPVAIDVTKPETITPALEGADVVVSLVGLLHGTSEEFEEIQLKGAENIAKASQNVGAKLIHISAIGADPKSKIPYSRTKGQAERSILETCPDATIVRPSIIFGPEDDFFNRFARLSKFLPFLPVFGGGTSLLQPIYVGDISHGIEIMTRPEPNIQRFIAGKITEAGGPNVMTFAELMRLVLQCTGRRRPVLSLPFAFGTLQGAVMERLPQNSFTLTRSQVEQLKLNNVVQASTVEEYPDKFFAFEDLLSRHSSEPLKALDVVLPTYLR
ncbi:hypothetical protein AX16_000421 [Volvariella volvacea WC 439]|nr:hypothetical protein AX16_000421 [Volvariella volvacea WC 439]